MITSLFAHDTHLLTDRGHKTFDELEFWNGHNIPLVMSNDDFREGKILKNYGYKHVIRLIFDVTKYIECTPETYFMNVFGEDIRADRSIGQILYGYDNNHSKVTSIVDNSEVKTVTGFRFNDDLFKYYVVGGLMVKTFHETSE